ncbi:MAG: hypothetical protein H0W11_02855 [Gemmatimonadetes bacterium]|nr:hypothetical protein [Gemmatimonadota bacterium]
MEFFADRNVGTQIFNTILRQAGLTIHAHQDYFPQSADDVDWLPEVAKRGWPIIGPDLKIAKKPLEVAAVMNSGAALFCLSGGSMSAIAQAENFLRCLPNIRLVLERTERPFIARVYKPNRDDLSDTKTTRVKVKLTLEQWEARNRFGI